MEDGRGQQNNLNLLHLNLPNSSSSSLLISCPYDSDAVFNHPFMINNINTTLYTTSSSLVPAAAPEICPSSHVDPARSLIINSNIQIEHVGLMGDAGKRRRKMTRNKVAERGNNREVIHVRAKRGQATDSHSIAERVRREKINEKLKALQHLVPGCYKTMGLAVMLDVIINYVQSLQNQIEFLSMKLSAASMFYDFNSPEAEAMEAFQRTNNSNNNNVPSEEAGEMERMMMMREDQLQGTFDSLLAASSAPAHLHSTWPF